MRRTLVKCGRPRITVDITLLKYLRDDYLRDGQHLGWLPIETKYYLYNKQRVSRDTLRRRYLEDILDRLEQRTGMETCRFKILRYRTSKPKPNIPNLTRCNWKPSKRETALPHLH